VLEVVEELRLIPILDPMDRQVLLTHKPRLVVAEVIHQTEAHALVLMVVLEEERLAVTLGRLLEVLQLAEKDSLEVVHLLLTLAVEVAAVVAQQLLELTALRLAVATAAMV
jgi:hypothetical protein